MGQRLKKPAGRSFRLTLAEVAKNISISVKYFVGLWKTGDYSRRLPGEVYTKSFLQIYHVKFFRTG
jgi:cytoskeletal protein RodZ